jgi:insertion element IS1 protein InsB
MTLLLGEPSPGFLVTATRQKLLDKIGVEGKTFVSDDWEGYHRLIPDDQLFPGKDPTVPIEHDNSNIRHFLARCRRRTEVVSKVVSVAEDLPPLPRQP